MVENTEIAWILAVTAIALTLIKWYIERNDDYWKKRGVPYLPRRNLLFMLWRIQRKNLTDILKEGFQSFNARIIGSFQGSEPTINITDPDILRDVLVKDFHVFPYRAIMVSGDPITDNQIGFLTGEDWKRVRTVITPAFTSKRMRQMGSIINDCSKTVLEVCERHHQETKPIDCKAVFGAFTMDVIARAAFGTVVDSHNDPNNEFVRRAKEGFTQFTLTKLLFTLLFPTWIVKWLPFDINPMRIDRDNFFRDVIVNVIKKRKETGVRYNDFLQIMMDAGEETAQAESLDIEDETDRFGSITGSGVTLSAKYKRLNTTEVLAQCVAIFMNGYETSANAMTFVAYCLAVNPEWQEKLIKEVDQAFEKHIEMSYDAIRDMKIMDAVVSESLRMHPLVLVGQRTAVEDYELGNTGIIVEKGMRVSFVPYLMHFDPEFFPDPETFNPERFMDGYQPKHPQYAYLPFGAGPRNCLGMRFALLEIKMCLANVLRHYKFRRHSTTKVPLEYKKAMILLTVNDLPLTLEKRRDAN